jgi:hypothetical protein
MNPTTLAAMIGALALVGVALINAYSAMKASQAERQAREANEKASAIIISIDGTQSKILAELQRLTAENADRGGQLKERERADQRQDLKDSAVDKPIA